MQRPQTPFERGLSDGANGTYRVPQGYTREEEREYSQGYDEYCQKLYKSKLSEPKNYGPYLDESWIPKNGGYS